MPNAAVAAAAGGALSALPYLLIAQGAMGAVVLAYFSQLPLFAVGFAFGLQATAMAALAGMVGIGLVAGIEGALVFGAGNALPVTILLRAAERRIRQTGKAHLDLAAMAVAATGLACAVYVLAVLAFAGTADGLQGAVRETLQQFGAIMGAEGNPQIIAALDARAQDFPGFVGASWMLMLGVNIVLAQLAATRLGIARLPTPNYRALSVPEWLWIPFGISGLVMVLGGDGALGFHGRNLFALCALPFFFQGLAAVHVLTAQSGQKTFLLVLFYFFLLMFFWHALFLVALLGLIDQWADLRGRRGLPSRQPEDE